MGYQYLMSTIPFLHKNSAPPMRSSEFVELAGRHLSSADKAAIDALASGLQSEDDFVRSWRDFDTQLRNASAKIRASKLGKDSAPWTRPHGGFDPSLERAVTAAFQEADPMLREKALDAVRWSRIDELAGFDAFSSSAVFAYYLKLTILEKSASHVVAQGREELASIIAGAGNGKKILSKA